MTLVAKVTNFNSGTAAAGNTVVVAHGLGESPKAIILQSVGRTGTVDSAGSTTYQRSFGWAIGSGAAQQYGFATVAEDGAAAGAQDDHRIGITDGCVVILNAAGTVVGKLDVQSWNATNVTFEVIVQFTSSIRISMLAVAGSDIANVATGDATAPTVGATPFTTDYTGLGFTPMGNNRSLLLLASGGSVGAFGTSELDCTLSIGYATHPVEEGMFYTGGNHQTNPTTEKRYQVTSEVLSTSNPTGATALVWRNQFSAWIADGFRLNNVEISGDAFKFAYLVIDGPRFNVVASVTEASVGADVVVSGLGYQGKAGIVFSHCKAESAPNSTDNEGTGSMGFWDSPSSQAAHGWDAEHGAATSGIGSAVEHDQCLVEVSGGGTVIGEMALESLNGDGCVYTMTDPLPTQSLFQTIFIGEAPVVGGSPPVKSHHFVHTRNAKHRSTRW